MVNKIDDFDKFEVSEQQAAAVDANKLDSFDVREINTERNTLAKSIRDAAEFNDHEKQQYYDTLASGIDSTDLSAIRNYKATVDKDRQEIRGMIDSYVGIINKNRNVFGMDTNRSLDAADQYIQEFMQLDYNGKKEWLSVLESDINERLELLRKAKEIMPDGDDYLRTLKRSEVKKLVAESEKSTSNVKSAEKIFSQNPTAFSEQEKTDLLEQLNDSSRHDQANTLNTMHSELKERKNLASTYAKLPPEYKSIAPDFDKIALDQRQNAIAKIEVQITHNYRNLQRNHPLAKHVSEDGKDEGYNFFKGCTVTEKIDALKMLGSQFEMEKKLSDEFEKVLAELAKTEKPVEIEKMKLAFYKANYQKKKEELIPGAKKKLGEQKETSEEEKKQTDQYSQKLDKAVQEGIIGKKTKEKSMKKWNKESTKYKNDTIENFDNLLAPYKALFERFQALPKDVREENKDFYESSHIKKMQIISAIEEKLNIEKEQKDPSKAKNGEQIDNAETINQKRLQNLTQMATTAERNEDYDEAYKYYQAILKMDPNDVIAANRIHFVESRIEDNQNENGDKNSQNKEQELINEAMRGQDVEKQRELFTIMKESASETKSSEAQHGTIYASKRQKDAEDSEVAEALDKYTDGASVLNKEGEAEEILKINIDENISAARLAELKRPIVKNIIKSSDPTAAKFIQFTNANGQKLSSTQGAMKSDQIEQKMKMTLADKVRDIAKRRSINVNEDSIEEKLARKDLEKLDMAA